LIPDPGVKKAPDPGSATLTDTFPGRRQKYDPVPVKILSQSARETRVEKLPAAPAAAAVAAGAATEAAQGRPSPQKTTLSSSAGASSGKRVDLE